MQKSKRKLKEELFSERVMDESSQELPCALQQKLSCCDGICFGIASEGAYLKASLCSCLMSCPSCFGKARQLQAGQAKECRDPNPARVVNLLNNSHIPARYAAARLDKFSNHTGNGQEVCQNINNWVRNYSSRQDKGLMITGPVGVGKTYILAAIAKSFAYQGFSVRFVDFFQLLNELKAGYSKEQGDSNIIKSLIYVDLLIIDELGKGRNSDWELSIIDQLVMGRYNQNKPIVASTNYSLKANQRVDLKYQGDLDSQSGSSFELNQFDTLESRVGSRIYSRLVETCYQIEITGEDFRKRSQNNPQSLPSSL